MANNPINLAVRFLILEVGGLYAFGFWGWRTGNSFISVILSFGLPILVRVIWAVFGTKNDSSRGAPLINTPGKIRLLLEYLIFALATWAFAAAGAPDLAWIYGVVAVVQNLISYDRAWWLIQH